MKRRLQTFDLYFINIIYMKKAFVDNRIESNHKSNLKLNQKSD